MQSCADHISECQRLDCLHCIPIVDKVIRDELLLAHIVKSMDIVPPILLHKSHGWIVFFIKEIPSLCRNLDDKGECIDTAIEILCGMSKG